jgi:hypothetical protein
MTAIPKSREEGDVAAACATKLPTRQGNRRSDGEEGAMHTHNGGSAKITVARERSLRADGWLGWAALLMLGSALVYGLLSVSASAEPAQSPPRIADIYNGFNHQPTRSAVEGRERDAGVGPAAAAVSFSSI